MESEWERERERERGRKRNENPIKVEKKYFSLWKHFHLINFFPCFPFMLHLANEHSDASSGTGFSLLRLESFCWHYKSFLASGSFPKAAKAIERTRRKKKQSYLFISLCMLCCVMLSFVLVRVLSVITSIHSMPVEKQASERQSIINIIRNSLRRQLKMCFSCCNSRRRCRR